MLAEFDSGIKEIGIKKFNSEHLTLAMLSLSEFNTYSEKLGLNDECLEFDPFELDYDDSGYFMSIEKISTDIESAEEYTMYLFIGNNIFAVVDSDNATKDTFLKSLGNSRRGYSTERLVSDFFFALVNNDMKELDNIEYKISQLEDALLTDEKTDNLNVEILKIKRKLLRLHSFYEQMSDITDEILKNECKIFNGKRMKQFKDFNIYVDKLAAKVDMLRESLSQLREAYQSMLDLRLNKTMQIFTVIATIFLPLSLITSWYGMNFAHMPELGLRYGYLYVIGLCVAVSVFCIVLFKKKKLM